MLGVSIVIRTINEKEKLSRLLDTIDIQDFPGEKEVIVVDNESTDGTKELAISRGAHVLTIGRETYTYPKAMNMGVDAAAHELVVLTVGHALPFHDFWLTSGARHFNDPSVAGIWGPVIPHKGASWAELLFYWPNYLLARVRGPIRAKHAGPGVLGATNCIVRKSLWTEHKFDERYELGGEDKEWADWATKKGYVIVCDAAFSLRHSHGLNAQQLKKQWAYWRKLGEPTKFDRKELEFRQDLKL